MEKNEKKENKKKTKKGEGSKKNIIRKVLLIIFSVIFVASSSYLIWCVWDNMQTSKKEEELRDKVAVEEVPENAEDSEKEAAKREKLEKLQELKSENEDLVGWLKIEDTNIDYPVVQTNDNDYYVNHNFEKQKSALGSIFLDKDCSTTEPTANFLIYGHRNKNGKMFDTLTKYKDQSFYEEHQTFEFSTLEDVGTYKIIAVFNSQIFYKSQKVFKYYFFKDAKNEAEFNDYVTNIQKLNMYQIDETASFGDQLITLSTCDYQVEDGRFVVVAKKIKD